MCEVSHHNQQILEALLQSLSLADSCLSVKTTEKPKAHPQLLLLGLEELTSADVIVVTNIGDLH